MDDMQRLEFLRLVAAAGSSANMWKLGEQLGLDRNATEYLCMDLFAQGAMEVVNLSGGVRLTPAGQACLGPVSGGDDPAQLVKDIQAASSELGLSAGQADNLAVDLATLEAALRRKQPLGAVVKACLAALESALGASRAPQAAGLASRAAALRG